MKVVEGPALDMPKNTLIQTLWGLGAQNADGGYAVNDNGVQTLGWAEVVDSVRSLAQGLAANGVKPGDRVGVLAQTRREWILSNHAIHAAGAVVVPIYPTLPADQVQFIVKDSGLKHIIVEDEEQAAKLAKGAKAWSMEPVKGLPSFDSLAGGDADIDAIVAGSDMSDPALLIYTSGTTGRPKGVLLDHRNLAGDVAAAVQGLDLDKIRDPSLVAFLPLAHIAGYVSLGALMAIGGTVLFSRPDRMTADLQELRPTIILAVPRLWERIVRKVHDTVAAGPGIRRALFAAAERTAIAAGRSMENGGRPGLMLRLRHGFFGALVYKALLRKLGMDRASLAITGAAAVRPDLLWFLHGIGIKIIEGYGMTESSALTTCTRPSSWRGGTVGWPLPGCKIALDDDGEILIGGIGVFQEYWNLPDETKETRAIINDEPWIRSGDIGQVDDDDALRIVDRKKELEVLDTGKMIAPVKLEEMLKSETELVEDSLLIGTDRKFASMLIQPAYDTLIAWAQRAGITIDEGRLRRQMAPTGEEQTYGMPEDILANEKIRQAFADAIERLNTKVADFERVRNFTLVPDAFTIDRDELTPSFKKKRRNILANHKERVEAMYTR